ncbi:MAG: galactose mutarotase, partial [Paludibacteraceae bacterium]|nr:galactose mutarotase [Paludibacteraceae bacterium]
MINIESFNTRVDGKRVTLCTLTNRNGLQAQITNYGAKVVSLIVPNKQGEKADVVLGFSTFEEWRNQETYFNAIIGRYANRIKDGKFALDGVEYQLPINNGTNSLHGGVHGFNEKVWDIVGQSTYSVSLHYRAKNGEEGYPGNLDVYVTYSLTKDNALSIVYEAKTDKPTILGFTNHAYFNLEGEGSGTVHNHQLQVCADEYTLFDDTACPTGEILSVEGTPMDFR